MATRPIRVWSGTAWEDVAIAPYDSTVYLSAATASATYIPDSIVNAKGDLITATANDTPNILTAGSNGQMLMADSSATAGLRYVDPPANRNLVINGAMQVAQRNTSVASITSSGYHTADRYRQTIGGSGGTWTQSIENDAPSGSGLRKSLKLLCTTARSSLSAGDGMYIETILEGQDVQRVAKGTSSAQQLTLSFWVKSNVTGTYAAALYDNDNNRSVSATYSISSSATWEKKTITFPADTTGAFDNDNAASLYVWMWLLAGSSFSSGTLATTWASYTAANAAVGQTNLAAATNNYWQITGVQLEAGPVATPFEFEPYETTLRKCQRYYYLHVSGTDKTIGVGMTPYAFECATAVQFPVTMRTAPSLVITTGTDYYEIEGGSIGTSGNVELFNDFSILYAGTTTATIRATANVSGTAAGRAGYLSTNNAAASIAFSAEL